MLDLNHLVGKTCADVQVFTGNTTTPGINQSVWQNWQKPRGASMVYVLLLGHGGRGGAGSVGASSAGGGGGGSGGQSVAIFPAALLPNELFIRLGVSGSSVVSAVAIYPANPLNNLLMTANYGGDGGNASGVTPGTAGTAAAVTTVSLSPLCGLGAYTLLQGQLGSAGGYNAVGGNVTFPNNGAVVCGGAGGGGTGTALVYLGGYSALSYAGTNWLAPAGATGDITTPSGRPSSSGFVVGNSTLFLGGAGGSGAYPTTGAAGSNGGDGMYGCGGGGGAGGFTGATASIGGAGGSGLCIIISW